MMLKYFTEKPKGLIKYRNKALVFLSSLYKYLLPKHTIFQEDWKNMIILDACRYDFFKKTINIDGKLKKIFSVATHTKTFCLKTFTKEKYDDIVCISTNPYVDREIGDKFHAIIPVWKTAWSAKYTTVLPKDVIPFVLNATIKYPHKRLLIWFVQPHYPYLYYKRYGSPFGIIMGGRSKNFFKEFKLFSWAHLSQKELKRRYMKNLIIVLNTCKTLLNILHGKTIISSDHGESLGDFFPFTPIRIYGHYIEIQNPKMYIVPYFICD